jgi:hypothetical protein
LFLVLKNIQPSRIRFVYDSSEFVSNGDKEEPQTEEMGLEPLGLLKFPNFRYQLIIAKYTHRKITYPIDKPRKIAFFVSFFKTNAYK